MLILSCFLVHVLIRLQGGKKSAAGSGEDEEDED